MTTEASAGAGVTLTLDDGERSLLLELLDAALADTRVGVHHSRTPSYKESLMQQESVIRVLIDKMRAS